jgi:hypothetical protein
MTRPASSVSDTDVQNRSSTTSNALGMRKMQERAIELWLVLATKVAV